MLFALSGCGISPESEHAEFADIHLHYNYTHAEVIEVEAVIDKLKKSNVVLATISSEPTDLALEVSDANSDWLIPFASPYYRAGNRLNWYFDTNLVNEIRTRLLSGKFAGIGEVHLTDGIGPSRDNPVLTGLLDMAKEFDLPFLIHTDAGDHRYFLPICKKYSSVRFIWAHAGGGLQPDQLEPLMQACPNVWLDLAARDPAHYGQLVDTQGVLLPGWRELIIYYQDRVMTGTDPVWNAFQLYRWYEADEGWDHYEEILRFHRRWLKQLPASVEIKVRLTNAQKFFDKP